MTGQHTPNSKRLAGGTHAHAHARPRNPEGCVATLVATHWLVDLSISLVDLSISLIGSQSE